MKPARIVFMGTPAFAVPSLKALIDAGHELLAVVTQPDKPSGRGRQLMASPVKELALAHGIQVLQPHRIKEEAFITGLKALEPEFIAVVAYGKILPQALLDIPLKGCINLHASLLPKYRGAAPINWAIINGEKETGACAMLMEAGLDTGPVLDCEKLPIGEDETADELAIRLSAAGAALLAKTITRLQEGALTAIPQDDSLSTYAPILKKEDGRIDWTKSAVSIKDHVRGFYPWPGAFTTWKGLLKVHRGRVVESQINAGEPGTVIEASKEGIKVACGSGVFEITELQPENKKRMLASEFVAGYRLSKGERFV